MIKMGIDIWQGCISSNNVPEGGPGSVYPGVYEAITKEINQINKEMI